MRIDRALVALLVVVWVGLAVLPAGAADPVATAGRRADAARAEADAADREYRRIAADASAVANELSSSITRLDEITDQITAGERAVAVAQAEEARLSAVVRDRAVRLYVAGTGSAAEEPEAVDLDALRRTRFAAVVNGHDDEAIENWAEARDNLGRERARLEGDRRAVEANQKDLRAHDAAIQSKLSDAQRARDAARAARDRQVQALKDAEAIAVSAKRTDAARGFASQRAGLNTSTSGGNVGAGVVIDGVRCPVAGAVSFSNDWGRPRSGGRTHKGTDMFSAYGTPNAAVIGGSVFRQSESVGGLSVYLQGDNGNTYYYTHLSGFAGPATGRVNQGDVVGYTGNSGNASGGVTHTHFEIRLGGPNGTRINPYPTLSAVC